ncbi:DMT family transporter [Deinococcus detaillensis]|uniref:DMT family transporter n=1 Tax=Deinococcus detaillensis TaxID=2592048 RepID=A0A553US18_9DEIO|nr:DMT family transporter [Deinococcus detaillensis]TSA82982.1 DMT family transporter [Deinococcus detaillensis]
MNPALLGLLSALSYGVGDFLAGVASRYNSPFRVAALTHPPAALILLTLAVLLRQPLPPSADLWWGAAAGVVGLGAVLAFYKALALGPMGAVSVGAGALSAAVPVAVGVAGGELLGIWGWAGALCVLLGTALLSFTPQTGSKASSGVLLGLLAGVGFGFYFVMLGQAHDSAGALWTLSAARVASSLVIVPLTALTVGLRPQKLGLLLASAPGDTLGNVFYLLAVQGGGLAIGALLTSLYPAFTTLLAVAVLKEKLRPAQWGGVALALTGAALLTSG